jgi:YHS domain-containing protein
VQAGYPGKGAPGGEMKGAPAAAPDAKKGDEAPKVEGPKAETSPASKATVRLTDEELAAIKELPAAEQAAAQSQLVCPVSDENLGSMGKPFKVTAEGRTFYLCCNNCEKKLKADPKAYVAKLDKKTAGK